MDRRIQVSPRRRLVLLDQPAAAKRVGKIELLVEVDHPVTLADAFAKHKTFDHIFVNMVRAGESSGTLDVVLERGVPPLASLRCRPNVHYLLEYVEQLVKMYLQ